MPDYRRYRIPGGCYYFTVNLLERHPNDLLVRHVDLLRETVREVRQQRPFHIDGWVVLPDYLHFNPVKHGHAGRVTDWPYSSFSRCVERGLYPRDWAGADIDADRVVGERG